MLKRLTSLILICIIILSSCLAIFAADPIRVMLDNRELTFDVSPQNINGSVMVPLRKIFESLGFSVDWNNKTKTATGVLEDLSVVLQIGNSIAKVNDKEVHLNTPAAIVDGATLVPVRFLAESTGWEITWDKESNTVLITKDPTSQTVSFRDLSIPPLDGITASEVVPVLNDVFKWKITITINDSGDSASFTRLDSKL